MKKTFKELWNKDENYWLYKLIGKNYFYSFLARFLQERLFVLFKYLKNIPVNSYALDLGCGSGRYTFAMEKELKLKVVGLDISSEAINSAKKIKRHLSSSSSFKVGSVENIPFDDNTFNIIFSTDLMEHVPNVKKTIKEMHRVLKKDGIVSIFVGTNEYTATRMAWPYYICKRLKKDPWVEKDLHISLYSAKNYRAMFCEAGFEVLKVHYNMINFIPFIFLFPRREDELYTMYPELKNMPLVRFTEIVRRIIEFVLPVKIILIGFGLLISKILLLLWKKPFGGTYFKLKKV